MLAISLSRSLCRCDAPSISCPRAVSIMAPLSINCLSAASGASRRLSGKAFYASDSGKCVAPPFTGTHVSV